MAEKAKVVKVGPGGARGPRPKVENPGKIFMRIMRYVGETYTPAMVAVGICIVVSVLATVQGTLFMQKLIDNYILPLLAEQSSDFSGLAAAIGRTAAFYVCGIIANFSQARIMAHVTQGTLKRLRDDLFTHMQTLPIQYFDRNAHGDIMSIYTNDTDTLRQMISQSIPQLFNSSIMVVSVLVSMIALSPLLTLVTLIMVGVMLLATKYLTGNSGKYFVAQQRDLGAVNGFIEEMMNGQKVVKVFCHEDEAIQQFNELNDALFESADKANCYANLGGPVNTQLGNLSYVLAAMIGGVLALGGVGGLTLGKLASFLTFNRSLNMPISQISMQFNSVIMALAGGQRVFALMDEKPEVDEGQVKLVNAKRLIIAADGQYTWNALYQGHPTAENGNLFDRTWWRYYHRSTLSLQSFEYVHISVDATFKKTETSDMVAILVSGIYKGEVYIWRIINKRMGFVETKAKLKEVIAEVGDISELIIEDKANGSAIIDSFRYDESCPPIVPVTPLGGKLSRAQAVSPFVQAGHVHLPDPSDYTAAELDDIEWDGKGAYNPTELFVQQHMRFPFAKHDDLVDANSQSLARLIKLITGEEPTPARRIQRYVRWYPDMWEDYDRMTPAEQERFILTYGAPLEWRDTLDY